MKRYALREDQWERIRNLLPGRSETVGVTAKDNATFHKSKETESLIKKNRSQGFVFTTLFS